MKELVEWLVAAVKDILPDEEVRVGAMPVGDGIGIYCTTNAVAAEYMTRSRLVSLSFAINGKGSRQNTAFVKLAEVHDALTNTREYAYRSEDGWNIRWIRSQSLPVYIGQEEDEKYLYGSSIEVSIYKEN